MSPPVRCHLGRRQRRCPARPACDGFSRRAHRLPEPAAAKRRHCCWSAYSAFRSSAPGSSRSIATISGRHSRTDKPLGGNPFGGITHVLRSRYLTAISVASIIASLLGTALYMFMAELVGEAFATTDERTRTFAFIDAATNTMAMLVQLLIVKRAVWHLGVGITLSPATDLFRSSASRCWPSTRRFCSVAAFQAPAPRYRLRLQQTDERYALLGRKRPRRNTNPRASLTRRSIVAGISSAFGTVKALWGLGFRRYFTRDVAVRRAVVCNRAMAGQGLPPA